MFKKIQNHLIDIWKHVKSILTKTANKINKNKNGFIQIIIGLLVNVLTILTIISLISILLLLSLPLKMSNQININPNRDRIHI